MKKLRRLLPVLIVLLALVWYLLPSDQTGGGSGAPSVSQAADTLNDAAAAEAQPLQATPKDSGRTGSGGSPKDSAKPASEGEELDEDGSYTTKEDVCAYLIRYGHLPYNFITKKEAQKAGWSGGSLERVLPGMCIGGDYFGNYEGLLPKAKGRKWTECDINTLGKKSRGAERIIFSNDGLIYYTGDHYESFELLYGKP
ncbi:MAG: ribonuclease [Oscillospiraceae bacterium]|nr:ribonuclease [Oscillospiraceae bacterium]